MNFLTKSFHFLIGFILFLIYRKKLNIHALLKGKRVAIVGAANSAYHTGKGNYIDDFDLVIRINKAPHVVDTHKWANDIGTRTDILFHSFFENEVSGGGKLDLELYKRQGIKYIVNPIVSNAGYRVTLNFYKKYLSNQSIFSLDKVWYKNMVSNLNGFQPTIGFCGLSAVIETDFSELYVTGFTFFKTAFGEGYRDQMREAKMIQGYIKDAGIHNPDKEFDFFCKLLKLNQGKNIILDSTLQSIVEQNNP
jgi:hypothetical protein